MSNDGSTIEKALVVFEQHEVDTLIMAMENYGVMDEEFEEAFGDLYDKLMTIRRDSGSEYRVK